MTEETEATPEAPPQLESLAEQVYRETHAAVKSTSPFDVVPNRPNILVPTTEEEIAEETLPEEGVDAESGHESAKDLIAQAEEAETSEELDEIEDMAEGRVTVLNAVSARRQELA